MADTKEKKISFWSGVKAEFGKIVWPNGKGAFRQSVAVILISVVSGLIIALIDFAAKSGVNWITSL
ncbi:MAG: preprotein translocase subunit SecE [Lachnospiraceae bacterium]|nr:preprotein translocase subunit SecE [Lachnospiraceae bacterium]MBP5471432.1 preprotein translocase subunit SecE [Lachnospiraceae bacterium]